jgi:hypothetical protein
MSTPARQTMTMGKSGRARRGDDSYPTPALNSAGLVLGLRKAGLRLPPVNLDPCGGSGMLARVAMRLEPGVSVQLADIKPQRQAADLYATLAPVDATILADLESVLRITKARAIVSNFPFGRGLFDPMIENALGLLRRGAIELVAVMQTEARALNTDIGFAQTALEPLFFGTIVCAWRAYLWPKKLGDPNPKGGYVWHVYTPAARPGAAYSIIPVSESQAEEALSA